MFIDNIKQVIQIEDDGMEKVRGTCFLSKIT